jgi:hypothetical protein
MAELSKIADRVRKLLALANSSNPNEAAVAAAQAQKLLQEHHLTEADVTADVGDLGVISVGIGSEGFSAAWRFVLVCNVARAFFCEAIGLHVGKRRKVRIFGRKEDIEVAIEVFKYLAREIERLVDAEISSGADILSSLSSDRLFDEEVDVSGGEASDVRSYKDNFRRGAVAGVSAKLKIGREMFAKQSEQALVLVKTSKDDIKRKMEAIITDPSKPVTLDVKNMDEEAGYRGYVAGQNIALPGANTEESKQLEEKKVKP